MQKSRFISRKLKHLLTILGISVLGTLIVLTAVGAAIWHYRGRIIAYITPTPTPVVTLTEATPANPVPAVVTTAPSVPKDLSVTDVVAKANKSVVSIDVIQASGKKLGSGTGFFVSSDGLILTNRHVVDFTGMTFSVTTASGKKYPAIVLGKDTVLDVAIIKVAGSGFPVATLGDSDKISLGESVVAIGFALGEFQNSISVGVVSGLARSVVAGNSQGGTETLDKVIQTDAAINPGNSGGPLLNLKGEVIGVNVAMARGSQSIGFALPIDSIKSVITSVKKTGTIVRPYVGIHYVNINDETRARYGLTQTYGIFIKNIDGTGAPAVLPNSPAQYAGLQENDIILSVDGKKLDETTSFASMIRVKSVGSAITLRIVRNANEYTVKVTLLQAPN